MIILGGGVTHMGQLLLEPALQIVHDRAMQVPRRAVQIVPAEMNVDAGLVGAGALVYHNMDVDGMFQRERVMVGAS
jgi:glucokinase